MDLNTAAGIAQVGSVVAAALLGIYAIWKRIDKRQTESYVATIRVTDRLEIMQKQLDVQFGGNGGGIREAINSIKSDQKIMDVKLDKACSDLANLQGKFTQHMVETDE